MTLRFLLALFSAVFRRLQLFRVRALRLSAPRIWECIESASFISNGQNILGRAHRELGFRPEHPALRHFIRDGGGFFFRPAIKTAPLTHPAWDFPGIASHGIDQATMRLVGPNGPTARTPQAITERGGVKECAQQFEPNTFEHKAESASARARRQGPAVPGLPREALNTKEIERIAA